MIDPSGSLSALTAPDHGVAAVLNVALIVAYAVCFASMVAYQIVQFRRSKRRRAPAAEVVPRRRRHRRDRDLIIATQSNTLGFLFVCIVALPLGIGFGILKYRLYDVDRLITRTLSYAIVTGMLVGVFVGARPAHDPACCRSRRRSASPRRRSRRGALQAAAPPRPAARRPPLQPRPLRRRGDGRGVRRSASATPSTSRPSSTSSPPPPPARSSPRTSPSGCAPRRNDSGTSA